LYQVKTKITHCSGPEPVVFEAGTQVEGTEFGAYVSDLLELGALIPLAPLTKERKKTEGLP
jgi:hypothetical protein